MRKTDCRKHKLLGRGVKKRMIALFMTAVMFFGCVYGAVSPISAAGGIRQGIKTTGINRLVSWGNHLVGKVITGLASDIDATTGGDGASKMASWISTWVFGNSAVAGKLDIINQKLDEIEDLCNQILEELDKVEKQLGSIEDHLSNQDIADAKERMDDAWRRDGDMSQITSGSNSVNYEGVGRALEAFEDYMRAAQAYKKAEEEYDKDSSSSNKSSLNKAQTALKEAELEYEFQILEIYTNGKHVPMDEDLREDMFTSYDVSDQIVKAIEGLTRKLCGDGVTDTYTDYAAQYAYLTKAFTNEQYDFVTTCMQRQLLQICNLEIMYQDYLSRQNEYLLENHGDNEKLMSRFNYVLGVFAKKNDEFSIAAADRMEQEIRFNPSSEKTIHLYTYVSSADTVLYEDDRGDGVEGIPPVLQKGVMKNEGTSDVFWFTKNTQEMEECDEDTNEVLRSMRNFEKELLYTGVDSENSINDIASGHDAERSKKTSSNLLTAGDLIFLRLSDLYPGDLISSYQEANTDYMNDPKWTALREISGKIQNLHEYEKYNCSAGAAWKDWMLKLFDTNIYRAKEYTPQSYLKDHLTADKVPSLMTDSSKDRKGSPIERTYVSQSVSDEIRRSEYNITNTYSYYEYSEFTYWYAHFMDLNMDISSGLSDTKDEALYRYEFYDDRDSISDVSVSTTGHIDFDEEDNLDIYCVTYDKPYKQNIRVKNSDSVEINGTTKETQVSPDGTVTLSFDKKSGDKVPVAVKYYYTNALDPNVTGDNPQDDKYIEDKLYQQDGEVVVDYDEMQQILALDPDAETVEMEIPVRYALNAAYEVIYEEEIGDVENLELYINFATDDNAADELKVSYDNILYAGEAEIYYSTDKNFREDVHKVTESLDNSGKKKTITTSIELDPDMAGKVVYVMVYGCRDSDYGKIYTENYVTGNTLYLGTPKVTDTQPSWGVVEVTLSEVPGALGYEVTLHDETKDIELPPRDLGSQRTTTFDVGTDKAYSITAVAYIKDEYGEKLYGRTGSTSSIHYTYLENDVIENAEVLSPSSVRITATAPGEDKDTQSDGQRFWAYNDPLTGYVRDGRGCLDEIPLHTFAWNSYSIHPDYWESRMARYISEYYEASYQNYLQEEQQYSAHISSAMEEEDPSGVLNGGWHWDTPYIVNYEECEELTYTFENLYPRKWKFVVQNYVEREDGTKDYSSNKGSTGSATIDLSPKVTFKSISAEAADQVTVVRTDDLSSVGWQVRVFADVEDLDFNHFDVTNKELSEHIVYDSGDISIEEDQITIPDLPQKKLYLQIRSWAVDPLYDGDNEDEKRVYSWWWMDTEIVDLSPKDINCTAYALGQGTGRVEIAGAQNVTPYVLAGAEKDAGAGANTLGAEITAPYNYRCELRKYKEDGTYEKLQEKDMKNGRAEFSGVPEGDCYVFVEPYAAKADGETVTGEGKLVNFNMGPPILDEVVHFAGDKDNIIMKAHGTEAADRVEIQYAEGEEDINDSVVYKAFKRNDPNQCMGMLFTGDDFAHEGGAINIRMRSVWTNPDTGEEIYSNWATKTYKDDHVITGINVGNLLNISTGGESDSVNVSLKANTGAKNAGNIGYDGLRVRLTTDKKGRHEVAEQSAKGSELTISQLDNGSSLDEETEYYVWVAVFKYGDQEEKVQLSTAYAGPYGMNYVAPADSDKKDPGATATPVPTTRPTPTPTPTDTGIKVGEKATAGSGATKAVYKATGKNTVTYLKTKVKKSAKKATVPAAIKIKGKKYKVTKIAKGAFKGYKKLKTVTVKAEGLTKKKVKGCFKGTSVKTVKVPKKLYKKYKKIFTKKITKSKVKVKVKKLK